MHTWWRSYEVPGNKMAPIPLLMWGVFFPACVVFLFMHKSQPVWLQRGHGWESSVACISNVQNTTNIPGCTPFGTPQATLCWCEGVRVLEGFHTISEPQLLRSSSSCFLNLCEMIFGSFHF
jgi:hypothetical protein